MISDGWMRVTPTCSQRRAPLTMSPNAATHISNSTPSTYSGSAIRMRKWGGILANTYITPSATSMLTVCDVTRVKFWFEPLKITTRLTPSSSRIAVSSGPSMCAVTRRARRLIAAVFIVFAADPERGGLLAEQIIIEDLARDRCGRTRAEARVFDQHGERNPRLVGRCVGDEQRMIPMALRNTARDVFFALLQGNHLRRAGLAGAH